MNKLHSIFILIYLPIISFSQIHKGIIGLKRDGFCGSSIEFTSDSTAFYLDGCEGNQMFTKLNYIVEKNGDVKFNIVPYSIYKPLLELEKGQVPFYPIDSIYPNTKLVL